MKSDVVTADEIRHPLIAQIYDPVTWIFERAVLGTHRDDLAAGLEGNVLELGVGTGAMLPHVEAQAASSPDLTYHGIEPDPYMRSRARRRARSVSFNCTLRHARAEALPYPDDSFDVVLAALVFCTIQDPRQALSETCRVLRPGGELRFLEHVAADGIRRLVQQLVAPGWRRLAGGCHPHRETDRFLITESPLRPVSVSRLDIGMGPIRPFVKGTLELPK